MINKDSILRLIYSILVAAFITMFLLLYIGEDTQIIYTILKGMLAGAVIWLSGELLFPLCEKIFPRSIFPGYIVLFLLIFLGTFGFGYLLGMRSIKLLIWICSAAEVFGIGITILYRRYYARVLNQNLEKNKRNLE